MSKSLRIEYAGTVIHDGPVDEFQMSENADSIAVVGKMKKTEKAAGSGLLDMLAAARKAQTANIAESKRAELNTVIDDVPTVDVVSEPEAS